MGEVQAGPVFRSLAAIGLACLAKKRIVVFPRVFRVLAQRVDPLRRRVK